MASDFRVGLVGMGAAFLLVLVREGSGAVVAVDEVSLLDAGGRVYGAPSRLAPLEWLLFALYPEGAW